ncbi:MAG: hypothetical protein JF564_05055, partial [Sphingomonas sp.]|nr:hypothetical protein [Sphingomonas sp.]
MATCDYERGLSRVEAMPRRRSGLLALLTMMVAALLCGCTANGGAMAINSAGPVDKVSTAGPAASFLALENTARLSGKPDDAKSMYESGYSLIYYNCNQYFDSAGKSQTILIATRDAIGAVSAVSTSILVLTKAPKSALAAVGIGTGAAYSGIDGYTKDFLFSAENVDAVRTLVAGALDTDHKAVLASFGSSQVAYDAVLIQLRDEQTICTLRHISALATEAIKNGHLVATSNTLANDLGGLARIQDDAVLSALGTILTTGRPVTINEAGALWEVASDPTADATRLKMLESVL